MADSDHEPSYTPSPRAVEILCERLLGMGVSMSESAARSLLESVLAVEGPRLHARAQVNLQSSLETIRRATDAALSALTGGPGGARRDYELSIPAQTEPISGKQRRVPGQRPAPSRRPAEDDLDLDTEPRPVFKRRRGR